MTASFTTKIRIPTNLLEAMEYYLSVKDTPLTDDKTSEARAERILKAGHRASNNCSVKNSQHQTALHLAIEKEDQTAINIILQLKPNNAINAKDNQGHTPVHLAALKRNIKTVSLLLSQKADINTKDSNDETPLISALQLDNKDARQEITKMFLNTVKSWIISKDSYINHAPNKHLYKTAIFFAAYQGDEEAVASLLELGAEIEDSCYPFREKMKQQEGVAKHYCDRADDLDDWIIQQILKGYLSVPDKFQRIVRTQYSLGDPIKPITFHNATAQLNIYKETNPIYSAALMIACWRDFPRVAVLLFMADHFAPSYNNFNKLRYNMLNSINSYGAFPEKYRILMNKSLQIRKDWEGTYNKFREDKKAVQAMFDCLEEKKSNYFLQHQLLLRLRLWFLPRLLLQQQVIKKTVRANQNL